MRKFVTVLLAVMMLVVPFVVFSEANKEADRKITFEESSYVVYVGKALKLDPSVENVLESAPKKTQLVWTTSDPEVALVNAVGQITGKKAGKVTITAAAKDNEAVSASAEVEVRVPVQSVQINEKNVSIVVGGKEEASRIQLTTAIKPADAFFQTGTWTSSNENVATVDSNGVVTGISAGNANITFTSDDPNGQKKAQTTVKVGQAVTGINVPETEIVHVKKMLMLKPEVLPKEATNKKLEFSSSDPAVATVSTAGQITGVANGEAVITCKATDGSDVSAEIKVAVFQPVQAIQLDKKQLTAFAGKTSEPLVVTIKPEDAKYQDYIWTSSDESIATVNEKGEVTGIAGGKVQIIATSTEPVSENDAPKSATCQVTVSQAVEYIKLEKDEEKSTNKKLVLKLIVMPETATNKSVEWSTSNKKIATVKNGVVTIKKKEGTATITAMATDGSGIYASCDVNVGFSGTTITIGSYVRRVGTYTWSVGNFSGNGVKPAEESPEVLLESYEFETKDSEVNREGKIFFRGIPWGIPYGIASKTGYLESYGDAKEDYYDYSVNSKNTAFINVAGYPITSSIVFFTYPVDETGNVDRTIDNAIFYKARYQIIVNEAIERSERLEKAQNIHDDLRLKLCELYGDATEASPVYAKWQDHGVTLELIVSNEYITIDYTWDDGEQMQRGIKEKIKNMEREITESMATPVPDSTDGL